MTKIGHSITGTILGFGFFSFTYSMLQMPMLESVVSAYLCYKGANAPDTLEISSYDKNTGFRKSVIRHRTYTHWFLGWVLLFIGSIAGYTYYSHYMVFLMGFALGGILHLITDLPNMSGIPIWHPKRRRKCLKWWKSGEHEGKISFVLLLMVIIFLYLIDFDPYKTWWQSLLVNKNDLGTYISTNLKELTQFVVSVLKTFLK